MTMYFARHGETLFNKLDVFQGHSNSALVETGKKQAQLLGDYLKSEKVTLVLASPLERVRETLHIINFDQDTPILYCDELKEICYGSWENMQKSALKESNLWEIRENDKFGFKHPGKYNNIEGESYADLFHRLQPFLLQIESKYGSQKIAVIAHLGVMRCAIKHYTNSSDEEIMSLNLSNNTIFKVSTNKNKSNKMIHI